MSTAYVHAKEALADNRGILVGFRDSDQLSEAVNLVLDHPERKQSLERASYAYAKDMTWPKAGERWAELMREGIAGARAANAQPRPFAFARA